jgi:hypothetical protein
MMRDEDPEEARYRAIRESRTDDLDTWDDEEPLDLSGPRLKGLGRAVGIGNAMATALGAPIGEAGSNRSTTSAAVPDSLPCRHCKVPVEVDSWVFGLFAGLSKGLAKAGERPIDPIVNKEDRPLCQTCKSRGDRARQALDAEAHQGYLNAKRRLLATVRPDAVERSDWEVIREHGGDVEVRAVRAQRSRRGADL